LKFVKMGKCKLTYFPVRALGESIRYILSYGGKDFEDERLTFEQWPTLKPKTPMAQLPILEIDGKPMLCQSMAICRYLAKEIGIAGQDNFEQAQADMIVDGYRDITPKLTPVYGELRLINIEKTGSEATMKELYNTFKTETLIPFLDRYEQFLTKNGSGYFVGSKLTWADIVIAEFLEKIQFLFDKQALEKYPKLAALEKKVLQLPGIKEYIDKRPQTMM